MVDKLQVKMASFHAYNKGIMSDEEVKVCYESIRDLNETMRAMGEKGHHLHGYFIMEDSLRNIIEARRRK
jgi:hypothetical protein